jgi:hypothetical protein
MALGLGLPDQLFGEPSLEVDPAKGLTMPENTSKSDESASPAEEMPGNGERPHTPHATPGESLHAAQRKFEELFQYVLYYLTAKADVLKVQMIRRLVVLATLAVAGLAVAVAIVTAVVLLCLGISDGFAALFGHRWIGELVTALLLLGIVVVASAVIIKSVFGSMHRQTVMRYEAMRRKQQRMHHRDVENWPGGTAQQGAGKCAARNPGAES